MLRKVPVTSQRQAPRLRSSASVSNPPNRLSTTNQSSKLGVVDRRSPRSGGPHSDQKKLGGRISDLESQLGQAQEELKLLKQQLANTEAVKKKPNPLAHVEGSVSEANRDEIPGSGEKETDVFEVPVEAEKLAAKEDEIKMLKARLYDVEKEHESLGKENVSLKNQLSVKANENEMASKARIEEELEESRVETAHFKEKLQSMEEAKEALEAEMKKLRVQTEQWRKAADAAAAVLSGESEMNGGGIFDTTAMARFMDHDDSEDGLGSGKRKSSGMKMFGELWKKRGHK